MLSVELLSSIGNTIFISVLHTEVHTVWCIERGPLLTVELPNITAIDWIKNGCSLCDVNQRFLKRSFQAGRRHLGKNVERWWS